MGWCTRASMSKPTYPTLLSEEDLRRSASGEYFYTFDKATAEKELRLVGRVRREGSRFFLQDEATGKEEEIPADRAATIFTAAPGDKSFKEGDPIIILPAGQQTGAAAYAKMVGILLNIQPDVGGTTFICASNNEVWWRAEEGIKLIPAVWPQTETKEDPAARKAAEEAKRKAAEEAKKAEEQKKFEEARRLEYERQMSRAEVVAENPVETPMTTRKDNKEAATAAMTKTVSKVMSTLVLRALVKKAIKFMVRMGVPRELATHKMTKAALMIAIPKILSFGAHYIPEGLPMLQDPNGVDRRQVFIDAMAKVADHQYEKQIEILSEQFTGDFLDRLMEKLEEDDGDLDEELDEEEERARRRKKAKTRRRDDDDDDDDGKDDEIRKLKAKLAKAQAAALPAPKKRDEDEDEDEDEEVEAKPAKKKRASSIQLQDSADD